MKKSMGPKIFTVPTPTPVWVIGSYDAAGKPNMMTVAWAGICCGKPPCVCISLREATYSYGSLMERKAFTVNIPGGDQAVIADYVGISAYSGREVDKFAATGMTAVASKVVDAPYGEEFSVVLECKVAQVHELGLHTQFIGEIVDVKVEDALLGEDGKPDINKLQPLLFAPSGNSYHKMGASIGEAFQIGKDAF